ncbi:MAG: hypothetical protein HY077_07030 [Elusimicrobia bacterium]|nr:hypothetical protein [Elusimicrobiota bacterium]
MKTRNIAAGVLLSLSLTSVAAARDAIEITEANGAKTSFSGQGIISFADDYVTNPRKLTLTVFTHDFFFNVNAVGCGAACTSLTFRSPEMGDNVTFTGANTADILNQFKNYLKTSDFLKRFIRLINTGPGQQISGTPSGSIEGVVRATFQNAVFPAAATSEQRSSKTSGKNDPQFSGGFAEFSSESFGGHSFGFSPGFGLDFGENKDQHLKFSFPLSQIDFAGLKTYQIGIITQYLYPVKFDDDLVLTVGPGMSFTGTFSLDLPNYSGLLGEGLSGSLNKDWDKLFATLGTYYGRFDNKGGVDTGISANIYGWGLQGGYRLGSRWVTALQLVGMHERVAGFPINTYHTLGNAWTYKFRNKFDLTFSVNKVFGLVHQRYINFGMGSAWFF